MALFYQALLYENIQSTWESAHCQSIVKEIMDAFTGGSAKMSRFTYFPRHKMSAARRLKLFCTPAWTAKNHFVGTGLKPLFPNGSPLGDPGPLGDLFVDLGPL